MKTCKYWYRWFLQQCQKYAKFQGNADIFDGGMTSSNVDVMLDILWRHKSVNKDDFVSKLSQFTSFHNAYLLVIFYDDRRARTCWSKIPSFWIGLVLEMALFVDYDIIIQQHKVGYTLTVNGIWGDGSPPCCKIFSWKISAFYMHMIFRPCY